MDRRLHRFDDLVDFLLAGGLSPEEAQQQDQRLHRLAQVMAGGRKEFRLAEIGPLRFRLGDGQRFLGSLERVDVRGGASKANDHPRIVASRVDIEIEVP